MPQVRKAERIAGVVYMPAPVSHVRHVRPHSLPGMWIRIYADDTPGTDAGDGRRVRDAAELGFRHPDTGVPLRLQAPVPADLSAALSALRG
jgi:hypothetical protein